MKYIVHYNLEHHKFILDPLRQREDIVMIELPVEASLLCKFLIKIDSRLRLNKVPYIRYRKTSVEILKKAGIQDEIILFNITYPMDIMWISEITGGHPLHVWTWNPVNPNLESMYSRMRNRNVFFYTFDENDALKYTMYKLPQVYRPIRILKNKCKNDFIFIGLDKNRANVIDRLAQVLEQGGYNGKVKIVGASHYTNPLSKAMILNSSPISYRELLEAESESNVIIDIVQHDQVGLTLRTMEALFMGKKLITNNATLKNYVWYHPNNIFILDNNENLLLTFMKLKPVIVDSKYLYEHNITRWIDNFKNS